jgi:holo-[acyl-carrier protein] synthase
MLKVGTDIVSIARIERSVQRFGGRFLTRYLNPQEFSSASSTASLAGYWAAKEAIAKALGCGIGSELGFHDILLHKDAKGAPSFRLTDTAMRHFPIRESSLSISHDGGFAIAVVVLIIRKGIDE